MNPFLSICQNVSRLGVMAVVAISIFVSCGKKQLINESNPNNLFTSILGKSEIEVQVRMDSMWNHFCTPGD